MTEVCKSTNSKENMKRVLITFHNISHRKNPINFIGNGFKTKKRMYWLTVNSTSQPGFLEGIKHENRLQKGTDIFR